MKVESNREHLNVTPECVYNALLNFTRNSQTPSIPQISDWNVTEDGISFNLNNMVKCHLKLAEHTPYSKVCYNLDTDKSISAAAVLFIEDMAGGSDVQIIVETDVPIFMQPMIKGPLKQGLNKALVRIKEMTERGF